MKKNDENNLIQKKEKLSYNNREIFLDKTRLIYIFKALKIIKQNGMMYFFKVLRSKLRNLIHFGIIDKIIKPIFIYKLNKILANNEKKPIVVFLPGIVDWNIPLFQRPQHIAMNLSKNNILYFFCTGNYNFDNIRGFKEINKSCYITDQYDLLKDLKRKKVIHLYSTDLTCDYDFVQDILNNGDEVIYEYVDEIHEDISGKIPEHTIKKHINILKNEKCMVIATADKLFKEVLVYRKNNCMLVTNGVQYEHFSKKINIKYIPREIKNIVKNKKPIIGYFGALASWFDYELVERLAKERPNYEILLIGVNYDGSIDKSNIKNYSNITFIGPKDYKKLPQYAHWFNVSIIPFKINEVTESTSPVKLFEYMAMGHPIVTTGMPECRKYDSVLIGEDHNGFIQKVDEAILLCSSQQYKKLIDKEALENTWYEKSKDISSLIYDSYYK